MFKRWILSCLLSVWTVTGWAGPYGEDPDAPETAAAAGQAFNRLGPSRGAVTLNSNVVEITSEVVDIIGLDAALGASGVGLTADVSSLDQAIENLNATVKETIIEVDLSSDVLFDFDSHTLKQAAEQSLNDLKVLIEGSDVVKVTVVGHTDSKGSEQYNQSLSLKRADSVRDWLTSSGIAAELIATQGRGERDPAAPNTKSDGSDNPEGRAKNRRVAITIETRKSTG